MASWRKGEEGAAAKEKLRQGITDLWILINETTNLCTPGKDRSKDRLPQALRLLPLWGLGSGALLWGAAWALYPGYFFVSAWLLVCLDLILGGLYILRRLMLWSAGIGERTDLDESWLPRSLPAVVWGFLWLLLLYGAYFRLLHNEEWQAFLLAMVVSRWIFCWLVRLGPEAYPGFWHKGFDGRCFSFATCSTLLIVLPFCSLQLFGAMLPALLGVVMFAGSCRRRFGCLYQNGYCFCTGWGQVLFLWSWSFLDGLGQLF